METAWPTCLKYLQSGLFKGNFVNHWTVTLNSCSYVMDCNRKFLIARIYILFQVTICFAPCQIMHMSNLAWVLKWCFSNCLEGTVGFISSPLQMFVLCKMLPITKKRKKHIKISLNFIRFNSHKLFYQIAIKLLDIHSVSVLIAHWRLFVDQQHRSMDPHLQALLWDKIFFLEL